LFKQAFTVTCQYEVGYELISDWGSYPSMGDPTEDAAVEHRSMRN